jgi:hypothetical protein
MSYTYIDVFIQTFNYLLWSSYCLPPTSQALNILFNTFIFFFCLLLSSIISSPIYFIRHGSTVEYCICLASRPIIEQCSFKIDIFLFISSGEPNNDCIYLHALERLLKGIFRLNHQPLQ